MPTALTRAGGYQGSTCPAHAKTDTAGGNHMVGVLKPAPLNLFMPEPKAVLTCIRRAARRPRHTPPALRLARPPSCLRSANIRPHQDAPCDSLASSSRWKARTTVISRSGVGFREELSSYTEGTVVESALVQDHRDHQEASQPNSHHAPFCVGGKNSSLGGSWNSAV